MHQTNHFFNLGYGWLCKHCSAEDSERKQHNHHHNRSLSSAEPAEERNNCKLSDLALAKWVDEGPALTYLTRTCPTAGYALCAHVEELKGLTGAGA